MSSTNNTTGKVTLGTTHVANYYTEVKGNVVVDYQDKQGNTIAERVVDTPDTSVGTAWRYNRPQNQLELRQRMVRHIALILPLPEVKSG